MVEQGPQREQAGRAHVPPHVLGIGGCAEVGERRVGVSVGRRRAPLGPYLGHAPPQGLGQV